MNEQNPDHPLDENDVEIISKTRLKKEMMELQELATYVVGLPLEQQAKLPLTIELRKAIDETKNIKKREALRRHRQYLGRLMRSADHEAIRAALDEMKEQQDRAIRQLHIVEQWRDELVAGDQEVLERFFDTFPHADRQQVRNLLRNAKQEFQRNKPPSNARKLFRYLREVITGH